MRSILALALLLSCLTGILSQHTLDPAMSKTMVEGCLKENGVSKQDLEDLQSGKVKHEDAKDNVKCSTQCILVKAGLMDSTGKLLTDKIKANYANSSMKETIEKDLAKCSGVKGDNACDTAFKMLGCFQGV
ncbi:general odorant-binding protein 56h [Drosophila eugracilis]|uniref:general odorant-binding protein 56h n=1 Tax=Drosophila eugracilis TaxID=29029 RepID=UPI0007E6C081|nr:general odorant-binding protein 56h [Drosophila eugracilis]